MFVVSDDLASLNFKYSLALALTVTYGDTLSGALGLAFSKRNDLKFLDLAERVTIPVDWDIRLFKKLT